ncbi:MAG TPA: aminoglycoside 6'-N-acetyltransferase [Terriglobia bacterium]|nr:aminoglycoside 6'-N-acetyltransferase [Terriglobia bacterium]
MQVESPSEDTIGGWMQLRTELWPHIDGGRNEAEARQLLRDMPHAAAVFVMRNNSGEAIGFAEACLRHDYVNGCVTSPVAFLEGIYVKPAFRRQGVARRLCAAIEAWAAARGCTEFASDAAIGNRISQRMHGALGFTETARVVYYRKPLSSDE